MLSRAISKTAATASGTSSQGDMGSDWSMRRYLFGASMACRFGLAWCLASAKRQAQTASRDHATLAKTSETLTVRADHAGTILPASAVAAPKSSPHHNASG